jgi:aryl-alcohol dehydrogenase-like predicted oxidoreductase
MRAPTTLAMCGPRRTCSAAYTRALARMRIDYVDVMQLHKPQRRAPHRPVLDNPETTEWKGTGSRQRLGYQFLSNANLGRTIQLVRHQDPVGESGPFCPVAIVARKLAATMAS